MGNELPILRNYLSPLLPGQIILAYCPAQNHRDKRVYVVFKEHPMIVRSLTQEEFDAKFQDQRQRFEAIGKP